MTRDVQAPVFDVQRFSIHDGPGIRTVVFFKGCALSCAWCHNPEAVNAAPELAYYSDRCLPGCSDCIGVCPEQALSDSVAARVDFARCTDCGDCIDACPAEALVMVGRLRDVDDLVAEVVRDRSFFDSSGGGVTLSGGEPLLHSRFLARLLPALREQGIHVAVETCGAYPFSLIEAVLPQIDLILFDLKLMDPATHERLTGKDNREILDNLRRLVEAAAPVVVRMPVVPGVNTAEGNLEETARFLAELGIGEITLLPYNHLWEAKLPRLGSARSAMGLEPPPEQFYVELRKSFSERGLEVRA